MIPNTKLRRLNAFKNYRLPSVRSLFERYGFSLAKVGHPDNTDPYNFKTPVNPSDSLGAVTQCSRGASVVAALSRQHAAEQAAAEQETTSTETDVDKEEKSA